MIHTMPVKSISQNAYETLKHAILLGEIPAGTRLIETYYSKLLHISRTPLREAIRMLEQDGLVTFAENRGATVTGFTLEDIEETFTIRNALMLLLLPSIVELATEQDFVKLRELVALMDISQADEDAEKLSVQNRAFHKTLEHISNKKRILRVIDSQEELIIRFSAIAIASIVHRSKAQEEHHQILAFLEQRDLEGISRLMSKHIEDSKQTCLATFKKKYNNQEDKT
ncbi:MAG: GntR family transcriptional regulator [Christensenellales bacterium]|nr:GntR family transcriptional regulator [Clostridiales bacterium]